MKKLTKAPLQPESEIKFGTDGWRGVISDTFTFKNVAIVSQAISDWINKHISVGAGEGRAAAVGFDNRFLSDEYAQIVARVFAANNITVYLSNTSLPTPALSFGVTRKKCVAGIMITASHNPGRFNGIKIKTAQGGAASKEVTDIVEEYLNKNEVKKADFKDAVKANKIIVHDFKDEYVDFLRNYLDLKRIKDSRYKVLVDLMHGSGRDLIQQILKGTKVKVELMREDVNPIFDNGKPEPVTEYLTGIMTRMKKEKYDLGLVLDGDADRIAAIAPGGEFISPQKILGLIILHLVRNRGLKGGIIKTICGTTMLDNIAKKLDCKLYETPVGFKYISDLMVAEEIVAGGEEAGGIGLANYIPERDGSLAGLLLLEMMVYQKKSFNQLIKDMENEFGRYNYVRLDLPLNKKPFDPEEVKKIKKLLGKKVVEVKDYDGVKLICEDESWLMFRPSGTEPLVRAYAEAKSLSKANALLQFGKKILS